MALTVLLLMLMLTAFTALQAFSNQTRQLAFLQQNGQLVLNLLHNELQNTGFWGGLSQQQIRDAISTKAAPVNDCFETGLDSGSFPAADKPFIGLFAATASGTRQLGCLTNLMPASEFLQVKRAVGIRLRKGEMRNNRFYLQLDWQQGRFVDLTTALNDADLIFPYQHLVLYVQPQQLNGHTIPVLMRKRLVRTTAGLASISTDSVIDGVERLHFEFLIDSNFDGLPNYSLATQQMTNAHWLQQDSQIVAIQYHVLLRTLEPDRRYKNHQQYQLGHISFMAPGDHFRRLALSGTFYFDNAALASK